MAWSREAHFGQRKEWRVSNLVKSTLPTAACRPLQQFLLRAADSCCVQGWDWACVGLGSGTPCVVPGFCLWLTQAAMLWISRRPTRQIQSGVNPDLFSGHQGGRNKAYAAMQIPRAHGPINAITTAPPFGNPSTFSGTLAHSRTFRETLTKSAHTVGAWERVLCFCTVNCFMLILQPPEPREGTRCSTEVPKEIDLM